MSIVVEGLKCCVYVLELPSVEMSVLKSAAQHMQMRIYVLVFVKAKRRTSPELQQLWVNRLLCVLVCVCLCGHH